MAKVTLNDPSTLDSSILALITANNAAIETAMEKTLSRDGTSPNAMSADLDMNSNQILNLPEAVDPTDPVRLGELEEMLEDLTLGEFANGVPVGGTTGQLLAKNSNTDYDLEWITASGTGTVTSVAASVPSGFAIAGSPITGAGTLAITYDTGYQGYTTAEASKLSSIEASADVTDTANVTAAGALMDSEVTNLAAVKAFDPTAYQAVDADLTSWAGVTRASGFDTFVTTPSSANLRGLLTDETGTGSAVFATSPTLVTPALGTPSALVLTNATGLPAAALVATTSTAVGFGTIELGHASDTTLSRSAAGVLAVEGVVVANRDVTVNAQTGTTYTLVLSDGGKVVTMSNASSQVLTIPANASVAFPTGTVINVIRLGAGATTVDGDTGVTVNGVSAGGAAITAQYNGVSILKIATDTWVMSGAHGTVA